MRNASWPAAWQTWSKSGAEIANTNCSGRVMRKVSRTSTETRRPSWVGTSLTGTSNGISRVVTRCETAIHGGITWLPGPIVRSMRPRRSRIAFEPSGTGTMNERKMPRNTRRTPTASMPPRNTSWTSRISPTMATMIPATRNEFLMRFGAEGNSTIGIRPVASGTPNASSAWSSGTRAWVNWMYGGGAPRGEVCRGPAAVRPAQSSSHLADVIDR